MNYLGIPSIYAHILNGIFVFTAVLFVIWNIPNFQKIDNYKKLLILLLLSISFGVHGISHLGLESKYNYNPMYYHQMRRNQMNCNMIPKRLRINV
jgi:hypothetical protein